MPNQQLQCPFCPKISSRGTGLASHIRGAHPEEYSSWKKGRTASKPNRAGASSTAADLAGGLKDILAHLGQQQRAIEKALSALREIEDVAEVAVKTKPETTPGSGLTPEGRSRLARAMKKRWALKRSAAQATKS